MENLNVNPSEISLKIKESKKQRIENLQSKIKSDENVLVRKQKLRKSKEEKEQLDFLNVNKIKISLSKNKELLTKEKSATNSKEIYKGMNEMSTDEKKKFRGKIRRNLHNFVNQILGKDRSEKERIEGIKDFLKFYKTNWKIQDFKLENFSLSQNPADKKDYVNLLKYVKDSLS